MYYLREGGCLQGTEGKKSVKEISISKIESFLNLEQRPTLGSAFISSSSSTSPLLGIGPPFSRYLMVA